MQKFQPTNNPLLEPQPEEIAETLLVEAGSANELPTDERKLLNYLGLQQLSFDFMHELEDFIPKDKKTLPDIRAALSVNDRIVATQAGLPSKRKKWATLHEIAHFIMPEHQAKLFLPDNDQTLGWWVKMRFEREANAIAAELMFQGNRFTEESLSLPTSIRAPIQLSTNYDASLESAIRRYAERHVLPCAVIVYDKIPKEFDEGDAEESEYKIHYTISSLPFRRKYFAGLEIKGGSVKGSELLRRGHGWRFNDITEAELIVGRGEGEKPWHFETEVFSNSYKIFQFLLPPKETLQL
jgi:Zn-dependent peptidase ImmA (M78 family)